jgi:hypothetical protein
MLAGGSREDMSCRKPAVSGIKGRYKREGGEDEQQAAPQS